MIELIIGGKIAPMPSLFSKCSIIHCSHAFIAFSREGDQPRFSSSLSVASVVLKNRFQKPRRAGKLLGGLSVINSRMLAVSGTGHAGLVAQITASGTTMPRVQADISDRLTGTERGSSMISGGTAGQRSHGY